MNDFLIANVVFPLIKTFSKGEALYSIYHLIEHLFINEIKNDILLYKDVYGQTTGNEISITIIMDEVYAHKIDENKLILLLKNLNISAKKISTEVKIMDNEIEMLAQLSNKKLKLYSDKVKINAEMINSIKNEEIIWDKVISERYIVKKEAKTKKTENLFNMHFVFQQKRLHMISYFEKKKMLDPKFKSVYFCLVCIPLISIGIDYKDQVDQLYDYLNDYGGFYHTYLGKDKGLTNLSIPSLEIRDDIYWITLFTFLNINDFKVICDDFLSIAKEKILELNLELEVNYYEKYYE